MQALWSKPWRIHVACPSIGGTSRGLDIRSPIAPEENGAYECIEEAQGGLESALARAGAMINFF